MAVTWIFNARDLQSLKSGSLLARTISHFLDTRLLRHDEIDQSWQFLYIRSQDFNSIVLSFKIVTDNLLFRLLVCQVVYLCLFCAQ